MLIKFRKAQSTLEYALLITVVVGALLGMQNYLKRSLMGRLQTAGDQIGEQYSPGLTYRKEYRYVNNEQVVETTKHGVSDGFLAQGAPGTTTTEVTGGTQQQNIDKKIKSLDQEVWH